MLESADNRDLKSCALWACGFKSRHSHQTGEPLIYNGSPLFLRKTLINQGFPGIKGFTHCKKFGRYERTFYPKCDTKCDTTFQNATRIATRKKPFSAFFGALVREGQRKFFCLRSVQAKQKKKPPEGLRLERIRAGIQMPY